MGLTVVRADSEASISQRIPRQAEARGEVLLVGIEEAGGYSGIAGEQHSQRRCGHDSRLLARAESIHPAGFAIVRDADYRKLKDGFLSGEGAEGDRTNARGRGLS